MKLAYKYGEGLSWGCWEPMSFAAFAAVVHAWRALDPSRSEWDAECSFEHACHEGVVFW